jgi:hypothetical protein
MKFGWNLKKSQLFAWIIHSVSIYISQVAVLSGFSVCHLVGENFFREQNSLIRIRLSLIYEKE